MCLGSWPHLECRCDVFRGGGGLSGSVRLPVPFLVISGSFGTRGDRALEARVDPPSLKDAESLPEERRSESANAYVRGNRESGNDCLLTAVARSDTCSNQGLGRWIGYSSVEIHGSKRHRVALPSRSSKSGLGRGLRARAAACQSQVPRGNLVRLTSSGREGPEG